MTMTIEDLTKFLGSFLSLNEMKYLRDGLNSFISDKEVESNKED